MADTGWIKQALGLDIIFEGNLTGRGAYFTPRPEPGSGSRSLEQELAFPLVGRTRPFGLSAFFTLARNIFPRYMSSYSNSTSTGASVAPNLIVTEKRSSLLSEFQTLSSLTSNDALNNFIVDVLEGQMITLVLVAAFVLVLLIREWVVQQQPILNMIADNGAQNPAPRRAGRRAADGENDRRRYLDSDDDEDEDNRYNITQNEFFHGLPWPVSIRTSSDGGLSPEPQGTSSNSSPDGHDRGIVSQEVDIPAADLKRADEWIRNLTEMTPKSGIENNLVGPDNTLPQMQKLFGNISPVDELRVICLALEKHTLQAVTQVDPYLLEENRLNIQHVARVIDWLPQPTEPQLRHYTKHLYILYSWTKAWLDFFDDKKSTGFDGASDSPPIFEGLIPDDRFRDFENASYSRPTMPERSGASRATEIQRALQDSEQEVVPSSNTPFGSPKSDDGSDGVDSDGSWHKVQNLTGEEMSPKRLTENQSTEKYSLLHDPSNPQECESSVEQVNEEVKDEIFRQTMDRVKIDLNPKNESASDQEEDNRSAQATEGSSEASLHSLIAQSSPYGDLVRRYNRKTSMAMEEDEWPNFDEPTENETDHNGSVIPLPSKDSGDGEPSTAARHIHSEVAQGREDSLIHLPTETSSESQSSTDMGHMHLELVHGQEGSLVHLSNETSSDDQSSTDAHHVHPELVQVHEETLGRRIVNLIIDWIWGDIAPGDQDQNLAPNDEHVVEDIEREEPFVPVGGLFENPNLAAPAEPQQPQQDPEVAAAAAQAGLNPNDPEGIEDAEDLEGIMELVGMQGPMTGLLTNAMFASVVISGTIACAIWIPFLLGKAALVLLAHPIDIFKFPAQCLSIWTNFALDAIILWIAKFLRWVVLKPLTMSKIDQMSNISFGQFDQAVDRIAQNSWSRIVDTCVQLLEGNSVGRADLIIHSLASLRLLQSHFWLIVQVLGACASEMESFLSSFTWNAENLIRVFRTVSVRGFVTIAYWSVFTYKSMVSLFASLWSNGFQLSLQNSSDSTTSKVENLAWSATDRSIAILIGYVVLASIGTTYYMYGAPVAESRQAKKIESAILDIMHQAGGILKVVLIISIEMLIFPLYCGLLLDLAMLPLFAQATFRSRIAFTLTSPWTSCFIHWFIGTCYMFHFALFVSMCRKILRSGVLYFIRDPDDPTFHPVRDVLERNVTSQLRKIGSSALIYGGLVIVCLGSVVWMLACGISGVLPVRWTNSSGILGFPIDLLLYTSLKPVAMRFFTPSNGLHLVYEWWFRKCARALSLSDFLFQEIHEDERRGRRLYIRNYRIKWTEEQEMGSYFHVPASDQVRIPRGRTAFSEVPAQEHGTEDTNSDEPHEPRNNSDFTKVLIPNFFKIRIALFVFCLWILTAGTGFSLTILPLLFGRLIFGIILPGDLWANDIYAFSLGMAVLRSLFYLIPILRAHLTGTTVTNPSVPLAQLTRALYRAQTYVADIALRALRALYIYTTFAIVIPSLIGILIELYLVAPLHGYLSSGRQIHVVLFLQDWTLGVQYVRLSLRLLRAYRTSRPARAFAAVFERGYTDPNARLATRCFFLPVAVVFAVAALLPAGVGWVTATALVPRRHPDARAQVQRFVYPGMLAVAVAVWAVHVLVRETRRWRLRIRDEVYLIGERLHNYGEKSPPALKGDGPANRRIVAGN